MLFLDLLMEEKSPQASKSFGESRRINEQLNRIVDHNLSFNGSYRSLENMAKIINSTPDSTVRVPETKHLIKKMRKTGI